MEPEEIARLLERDNIQKVKGLRSKILRRDRHICRNCERQFRSKELVIRRISTKRKLIESNLMTLCLDCSSLVDEHGFSIISPESMLPREYRRPDWHRWVYAGGRGPR